MSTDERESPPATGPGAADGTADGTADGGAGAGEGPASFEALYERLEQVARELDAGGLSLERSVALYEEGIRLAESCERLLADVEQRIEMLRPAPADGGEATPGPRLL